MKYKCANCCSAITGEVYSINRDGPDRGPEVALCEKCYGPDVAAEDIWANIRARTTAAMPGPDASRAEIDAWYSRCPVPIPHEAPPIANGPSIVCNACGVIRVKFTTPFCRECQKYIPSIGLMA
jgi:hypothetical protein